MTEREVATTALPAAFGVLPQLDSDAVAAVVASAEADAKPALEVPAARTSGEIDQALPTEGSSDPGDDASEEPDDSYDDEDWEDDWDEESDEDDDPDEEPTDRDAYQRALEARERRKAALLLLPTFKERVDEKVATLRYTHNLHRAILSPQERELRRYVDRRAAFWMPLMTLAAVVVCAVLSVSLAVRVVSSTQVSAEARSLAVGLIVVVLIGCFVFLLRAQDRWDNLRPYGRIVRNDVADAYETVRDSPYVLAGLGVPDKTLVRVVELLPVADRLVDFIVQQEAISSVPIKGHRAYEELIRMSAEVQVIIEMRQEELGRRPSYVPETSILVAEDGTVSSFDSLEDLIDLIVVLPNPPRRRRKRRPRPPTESAETLL